METLKYTSTRNHSLSVSSIDAIIKGLAEDGGLYVPSCFPSPYTLDEVKDLDYKELAVKIIHRFFSDFEQEEIRTFVDKAYDGKFHTGKITPLVKKGEVHFLELFHGPTLAFKDMALTFLPYLLKGALEKNNLYKKVVILTATSGDTGKAALEGFKDIDGIQIIVFYPTLGVSEIQKKQMMTQKGNNVHVVGIHGNFDDAQNALKEIFNHSEFNRHVEANGYTLSSANSINIGRLIPQIIYYFFAYFQLVKNKEISLGEPVNIAVPTGNFGNILAAYYGMKLGLPIHQFICASNENKVLADFFNSGIYDRRRNLKSTISPSMDILISSNLERLLYDLSGENSTLISEIMEKLKTESFYFIPEYMKEKLTLFYGGSADEEKIYNAIKKVYEQWNYVMDPHTAVAYSVYEDYVHQTKDSTKTIIVSTASPFKFTKSVCKALHMNVDGKNDFQLIGEFANKMSIDIPLPVKNIHQQENLHHTVCNKEEIKSIIENILKV